MDIGADKRISKLEDRMVAENFINLARDIRRFTKLRKSQIVLTQRNPCKTITVLKTI